MLVAEMKYGVISTLPRSFLPVVRPSIHGRRSERIWARVQDERAKRTVRSYKVAQCCPGSGASAPNHSPPSSSEQERAQGPEAPMLAPLRTR